jgi:hypothetical protein
MALQETRSTGQIIPVSGPVHVHSSSTSLSLARCAGLPWQISVVGNLELSARHIEHHPGGYCKVFASGKAIPITSRYRGEGMCR